MSCVPHHFLSKLLLRERLKNLLGFSWFWWKAAEIIVSGLYMMKRERLLDFLLLSFTFNLILFSSNCFSSALLTFFFFNLWLPQLTLDNQSPSSKFALSGRSLMSLIVSFNWANLTNSMESLLNSTNERVTKIDVLFNAEKSSQLSPFKQSFLNWMRWSLLGQMNLIVWEILMASGELVKRNMQNFITTSKLPSICDVLKTTDISSDKAFATTTFLIFFLFQQIIF